MKKIFKNWFYKPNKDTKYIITYENAFIEYCKIRLKGFYSLDEKYRITWEEFLNKEQYVLA